LPLPPLKTQRRIAARLRGQFEHLQQRKAALTIQLEVLDRLPGTCLREAFGGLQ
jgi:restriction endonuclease S subunit